MRQDPQKHPDVLWHPSTEPVPDCGEPRSGFALTAFGTMHLIWTKSFLLEAGFKNPRSDETISPIAQKLADCLVSHTPLPIRPLAIGTPFQLLVWQALKDIPFGATTSYQNIALTIGTPKASRAVGSAIGANRFALLIPCHRVIRTNGHIGGFGWGISIKQKILAHERP